MPWHCDGTYRFYIQCKSGETYFVLTESYQYRIQIRIKHQQLTTYSGSTLPSATKEYAYFVAKSYYCTC